MYDPDPATIVIRFAEIEGRTIGDLAVEREDILREMEALNVRLVEVDNLLNTKHAQAQPIPASVKLADNDFWTAKHKTEVATAAQTNANVQALLRSFREAVRSDEAPVPFIPLKAGDEGMVCFEPKPWLREKD